MLRWNTFSFFFVTKWNKLRFQVLFFLEKEHCSLYILLQNSIPNFFPYNMISLQILSNIFKLPPWNKACVSKILSDNRLQCSDVDLEVRKELNVRLLWDSFRNYWLNNDGRKHRKHPSYFLQKNASDLPKNIPLKNYSTETFWPIPFNL